ncbi:MAG: GGDEF domain-containing protein [Oligoflexales bacterium]
MQQLFENLSFFSERLWQSSDKEQFLQEFASLVNTHFHVSRIGLVQAQLQSGSLDEFAASPQIEGVTALDEQTLDSIIATLRVFYTTHAPSLEGLNFFEHGGRQMFFVELRQTEKSQMFIVCELKESLSEEQRGVLAFLALQLQQGLRWILKLDKTQALIYLDDLTNLYNYRYLDLALEAEIRRSQRFGTPFCLLFIDLDNLKPINDKFGHIAGSQVLKHIAQVLKEDLREVDSVFRYGGDEYVVLLLEANTNVGRITAERIRQKIESTEFRVEDGHTVNVTASIGVANCPEHGKDKATLLRLADESMYRSKKSGKNRVVVTRTQDVRESAVPEKVT